jgi:negative regulator of flagellin synthesis FlgM
MKVSNNKIGNPSGNLDAAKTGKADPAAAKKDSTAAALLNKAQLASAANVNVSERAQMMAKAKEIAGSPMSVDEAKVARLQKMIDEGKYKVDADKIADRLVDEHMSIPD